MVYLLYTVNTLFIILAIILILLVLIQKGRGGGLASAFGGVGGHTAFGSKTGDVLTWATAIVFGVFLLIAVLANIVFNKVGGSTVVATPMPTTAPATPTPAAPGSPESSLPQGPVTADPGVANPPTAPTNGALSTPAPNQNVTPTTRP